MKNFLLIEHGGKFKSFTLQKALDKKLNLFIATSKPEAWLHEFVDKNNIIACDTQNITELILSISVFMKSKKIDFAGVGTFFEDFVTQTAEVSNVLGLKGNTVASSYSSSRNKLIMRDICNKHTVRQPAYDVFSVHDKQKIISFLINHKNAVIKPIYGGSSVGVQKVTQNSDIDFVIQNILDELHNDPDKTFVNYKDFFLIEEYLDGDVVSIDGLIQDNKINFIGNTQFYLGNEPKFLQLGGITPINVSRSKIKELQILTRKIIKILGFDNCGFHCELRLTSKGPKLIEIASRLPGGPIQLNYMNAYGVDSTGFMYDIWLGRKILVEKTKDKYVLYKNIYANRDGVIQDIKIDDLTPSYVLELIVLAKVGQEITKQSVYPKLLYYYAVIGDSKEEVESLSAKVENSIEFILV